VLEPCETRSKGGGHRKGRRGYCYTYRRSILTRFGTLYGRTWADASTVSKARAELEGIIDPIIETVAGLAAAVSRPFADRAQRGRIGRGDYQPFETILTISTVDGDVPVRVTYPGGQLPLARRRCTRLIGDHGRVTMRRTMNHR
jgi:hypothetical protein